MAPVGVFGGHIVQIKGTYNECAQLAVAIAKRLGFYLAGDYAFRLEGQKTAAFEIIDQMSYQVPDVVIVPIGCGTNIAAYAKGFHEYLKLGLSEKVPQLIGVQAEGAAAVVNSFLKKLSYIEPLESVHTLATAIAVPNPLDGIKALDAIYSSGGEAIAVSDEEMLQAQYQLATEESLFVESAASATLAALRKLSLKMKNKKIICILTGDGLKDPNVVLKASLKPPIIEPKEEEFLSLYRQGFFAKGSRL
jgi:threonine synthase